MTCFHALQVDVQELHVYGLKTSGIIFCLQKRINPIKAAALKEAAVGKTTARRLLGDVSLPSFPTQLIVQA